MTTRKRDPRGKDYQMHRREDFSCSFEIETEPNVFLRMDDFETPAKVQLRMWRDDTVFYEGSVTYNPLTPTVGSFSFTAANIANVRTTRIFYEVIGQRKSDGGKEIIVLGQIEFYD